MTTPAVVEDVDPQTRQVLLRLPDNTLVTLKVGSDVKNLRQLKPGEHVNAEYVAAKLVGVSGTVNASGPIEQMSSGSGGTVQGPTTIIAVDPNGHTVSFVGPDNTVEIIHVAGDAMIQAVTKLTPGRKADIAYVPAVAVRLNES